jgi:hypothetical protein
MPLIPNTAVLQRIATLPLATYQAGETVLAAGTIIKPRWRGRS